MRRFFLIGTLFTALTTAEAADFNLLSILQFSSYNDISTLNIPLSDVVQTNFQPVYLVGYAILDARFQNIGIDQWMFRGLIKGKGIFLTNRYIPDVRYAYVENKKPAGKHWFFSAGLINPMNLLPVQRLAGANIAYTPDAEKGWRFGLIGGMVPDETSGYRSLYYSPFRVGAYTDYTSKSADHFKVQYNAGFGAGKDIFHQGQLEVIKKYLIFKKDAYIRGGIMFTFPYKTIDYALAENSIFTGTKTIHTIGYLKSETLFLISNSYDKEKYQQAFYKFTYTSTNDEWLFNLRGGYTYSMSVHGYIAQAQLMRRKLLAKKNGLFSVDLLAQKKGVYDQIYGRFNFGLVPIWVINLNVFTGYEYFRYKSVNNNAILYGVNLQGEFAGNFSFELSLDFRTIITKNTDFNAAFTLVHMLNTHIGKKETELPLSETEKLKETETNPDVKSEPDQEKNNEGVKN